MKIRGIKTTPFSKAMKVWTDSKDFRSSCDGRSIGVSPANTEFLKNRLIRAFEKGWSMRGEADRGGRWIKGNTPPPADAEIYLCTYFDHNSESRYVATFFWDSEGWHKMDEEAVIGDDITILAYRPLPSIYRGAAEVDSSPPNSICCDHPGGGHAFNCPDADVPKDTDATQDSAEGVARD